MQTKLGYKTSRSARFIVVSGTCAALIDYEIIKVIDLFYNLKFNIALLQYKV